MCGNAGASEPELSCTVPLSSAVMASPPPLNTTSESFGNFSRILSNSNCNCAVVPIGGVAQLYCSGLAAGERDEFLHGFRRQFRLDHERVRRCRKLADCDEILVRIVGQLVVKPVIHRIGVGGEQDGVAIRLGMGGVFHADIAAGAAAIVDDEGLAGRLLERRRHHAGNDIGRAAGRIGDHEFDRAVRISGIGRAHAQKCRRGDAGGEHARGFDDAAT